MSTISFFCPGLPRPKGSTRAFVVKGRAVTVPVKNKETKSWEHAIATGAMAAGATMLEGCPVFMSLIFRLPRPQGHFGKKGLKASAPGYPIGRVGDIDKLARAVLDALSLIAYRDDSQVVRLDLCKRYVSQMFPHVGVQCTIQDAEL